MDISDTMFNNQVYLIILIKFGLWLESVRIYWRAGLRSVCEDYIKCFRKSIFSDSTFKQDLQVCLWTKKTYIMSTQPKKISTY